jgi:predicted transcriptional regulator
MTNEPIDAVLERVRRWPPERQAYAVEVLQLIEAQSTQPIQVSDEEWAAIQEGNAQAERGEFVSDADMSAFFRRHGL